MYESYFGLTGSPFRLSPDPDQYFPSPQHEAALAALRASLASPQAAVVLTGEIGSGKTLLLRRWMRELLADPAAGSPAVAWVANTQLADDDVARAVAIALGVPPKGRDEPGMATLLAYMGTRPTLLIVDEAQHLGPSALRWLLQCAAHAATAGLSLHLCLAGQPELRSRLEAAELALLRWQLHDLPPLQPLDARQTRQYLLHRLRSVGWAGHPRFEEEAFVELHHLTGGLPRRLHLLCDRVMLAQYLGGARGVTAEEVWRAAQGLRADMGITDALTQGWRPLAPAPAPAPALAAPPRSSEPPEPSPRLLLLASGRSGLIKARPLLRALAARADLPACRLVSAADAATWRLHGPPANPACSDPALLGDPVALGAAGVAERFGALLARCLPCAVLLVEGDPVSRACSSLALTCGVPQLQFGSVQDLPQPEQAAAARREGLPRPLPVIGAGNLLIDAVVAALRERAPRPAVGLARPGRHGYGVVVLQAHTPPDVPMGASPFSLRALAVVQATSRVLPLIWPLRAAERAALQAAHAQSLQRDARVDLVEELSHPAFIRLLQDATCVLTDLSDVIEEAAVLGVPCLSLGVRHVAGLGELDVGFSAAHAMRAAWALTRQPRSGSPPQRPAGWDGRAAERIAEALALWLALQNPPSPQGGHRSGPGRGARPGAADIDHFRKDSHGSALHP